MPDKVICALAPTVRQLRALLRRRVQLVRLPTLLRHRIHAAQPGPGQHRPGPSALRGVPGELGLTAVGRAFRPGRRRGLRPVGVSASRQLRCRLRD